MYDRCECLPLTFIYLFSYLIIKGRALPLHSSLILLFYDPIHRNAANDEFGVDIFISGVRVARE